MSIKAGQIQEALNDIETIVRWAEVSTLAAGQETFFMTSKVEEIPAAIGEKLGIPENLIRTPTERKEVIKILGQAQAAASGGIPVGSPENNIPVAA